MTTASTQFTAAEKRGILAAFGCYAFWGSCPLFWKLLDDVSSVETICHRIIWCTAMTVIACLLLRINPLQLFREPRARKILFPAAILITINWSLYIYAVNINHVVETALGYYINPLVSILFGMAFFKERLTPLKWAAVVLCAVGVIYFMLNYGQLPWIALTLAVTFGAYGAVKKKGGYPAIPALAFENIVLLPFVIGIAIAWAFVSGSHAFLGDVSTLYGWWITLLLVLAGPITAIPLLLFAKAANSIPLTILGFAQYLSPTIALLIGVLLLGEPFTLAHAVCLGCIWSGLVLVTIDSLRK